MAEPHKSRAEQIEELHALINRLKGELAELERLQAQSAEISAGLESVLKRRPDQTKKDGPDSK